MLWFHLNTRFPLSFYPTSLSFSLVYDHFLCSPLPVIFCLSPTTSLEDLASSPSFRRFHSRHRLAMALDVWPVLADKQIQPLRRILFDDRSVSCETTMTSSTTPTTPTTLTPTTPTPMATTGAMKTTPTTPRGRLGSGQSNMGMSDDEVVIALT